MSQSTSTSFWLISYFSLSILSLVLFLEKEGEGVGLLMGKGECLGLVCHFCEWLLKYWSTIFQRSISLAAISVKFYLYYQHSNHHTPSIITTQAQLLSTLVFPHRFGGNKNKGYRKCSLQANLFNIKESGSDNRFMNDNIARFIKSLSSQHYSSAFVQHLVDTIADNTKISTLQQIYQLIQKESDAIITHFNERISDNKLIEYRNPLCFQSLRHYFHTMTRGVYKKYGNDINKFKEGLKVVSKQLIEILSISTNKIVKFSETLLKDNTAKKILVYSYSKSICLSLKRLAKSLEDNLLVYVCKSGSLEQGICLYEELVLDGVKCQLINDNEIGYYIHQITCVLVGAEVILENGAILNRAGTSMVALLANHSRKPVYVFAQSYKFLRKIFLCQRDIPQCFRQDRERKVKTISVDLTQPELITMFCTDNGLINPEIISLELSKVLK